MDLTHLLEGVGGGWTYPLVAAFAFLESAAFVGLVIPGETVMLLGGVLAAAGQASLLGMMAASALGALAGDQTGYVLGRALGPSLRTGRLGRRVGTERWARAERLVARRGGPAVFLGRRIGVLRAVVPAAAGATGMPRAVFTAWNVVGGVLWAATVTLLGFAAGASWPTAGRWLGSGALVAGLVTALLATVVVGVRVRRHARRRRPDVADRAARWRPRPAVVAGVVLAGVLAVAVGEVSDSVTDSAGPTAADGPLLGWIVAHRDPVLTAAARTLDVLAGTGALAVVAAVCAVVLFWRGRRGDALVVLAVTGGAGGLVLALKALFARPRPPLALQMVTETNASFPSGHALGATSVLGVLTALALAHVHTRRRQAGLVVAATTVVGLIGASRLYLGVHWTSDVVAGWLFGALWLTLCLGARASLATPTSPTDAAPDARSPSPLEAGTPR